MHLDHLTINLQRRARDRGVAFELGKPVGELEIQAAGSRLGLSLPLQVQAFYLHSNGLKIIDPPLEILSLETLALDEQSRLTFAVIDGDVRLAFDTKTSNAAGQWNIVEVDSNSVITLTMASLWSNKIWKWIDWRKRFWKDQEHLA